MENIQKLSIRHLVEFIVRSGDIDSRYVEKDRMYEGAKAHRLLQKRNAEHLTDYKSEVSLKYELCFDEVGYRLEGRADGIFTQDGRTVLEEIKTTVLPLELIEEEYSPVHWAQAKCYACIYAVQSNLDEMDVQLTYFNLDTQDIKPFLKSFSRAELEGYLEELLKKYTVWARLKAEWEELRNASAGALAFPFSEYRPGQRRLAVGTYRAIEKGRKLFAQAPTGTGKTISALFPAVKAMGEGKTSKIFYLTAKTITRQVAEEAFEKMRAGGLRMKSLTLTAKDKICFCEKRICTPEHCVYAKGYFDRVNDAVLDAIQSADRFTRPDVEVFAKKHTVCPFEFSLDLSLWVDCVICDYNYVFDPQAYLRRFFAEGGGDYTFLIDEAHNLVDRSREMFSAELRKTSFYQIKKVCKDKVLNKILTEINKHFLGLREECGEQGYIVQSDFPHEFLALTKRYTSVCEFLLKEDRTLGDDNEFLQLYFEVLHFQLIADFYDERYVTFIESAQNDVTVKLFCLDPSYLLSEAQKRGNSSVFFSATLTPLAYFREILGGSEEDWAMALESPFAPENLCLMTAGQISTKYQRREESVLPIAALIHALVSAKTGNYIVFFPSYRYMHDVFEAFTEANPNIYAVEQQGSMSEEMREEFMAAFQENPVETMVSFCVLGGIFSEGIDLKGSRLIGTVIVSVGLPQLSVQQNIIRDYFNQKNGMGYEYAYMFPGMNKVLQAAGRVIRSESDRGVVLLVDERYESLGYRRLFPAHWRHARSVRNEGGLREITEKFWE